MALREIIILPDKQWRLVSKPIEKVTAEDVLRLADRFFTDGSLAVTVLGNVNGLQVTKEQLAL